MHDASRRGALLVLALMATGCSDDATSPAIDRVPPAPRAVVIPGVPGDFTTSLSVAGPLTVSDISEYHLTISNAGPGAYGDTAFAWVLIPAGIKRQIDASPIGTDPLIRCETYRGHQGGFTKDLFSDYCRVWFTSGIPAGGSVTAIIPFKPLAEGDYTGWTGTQVKRFSTYVALEQVSVPFHVSPAVKAPGGGGGGGGTGTPDLQSAGAKASSGAPVAGTDAWYIFTAKNGGKGDATDPTFTITFPAGIALSSAAIDLGSCTISGRSVTCTTSMVVPVGGQVSAYFNFVAPTAPGSYSSTGTWSTSNGDSNPGNNATTIITTIR